MLNRLKPLFVNLVLITGFMGCQQSVEEITFSEGNIQADSPIASLVKNMAAFDGSFDNAIDNSSCISVKLPVDVEVNGQSLTVSSSNEISQVEEVLALEPFDFDNIQISFPIEVILSDHSEQRINSQEEFDTIRGSCVEGGLDADIECIDFTYPVSFNVYDGVNQRVFTKSLSSDKEIYQYVSGLNASDIVTFDFPLALSLADGNPQEVSSNENLSTAIENNLDACDESDVQLYNNIFDVPYEIGQLSIELTDAPFPTDLVSEANVIIDQVDIKMDNEEETILTISEEEFDVNLLDLTNGTTLLLVDLNIPEGLYNEVRLSVKESTVLLEDGTEFDLTIPSGEIKIKIAPSIEIDATVPSELLLDFDVSRSFVVQGNPNTPAGIKGFLFKPVVKAVNRALTGTLSGTVTDVSSAILEGAQISVFAADTLNTTSFTDANGEYLILGLLPGDYEITAELDGFTSSTELTTIVLKENAVINFQLVEN